jgi:hypothetical protein
MVAIQTLAVGTTLVAVPAVLVRLHASLALDAGRIPAYRPPARLLDAGQPDLIRVP